MAEQDAASQLAVCSWSLAPPDPRQLVEAVRSCGLSRVQLALNPIFQQPHAWTHVAETLRDAGITLVSGMFGCVGEDYSTLDTIRATGGLVPDRTWEGNRTIARSALDAATDLGIDTISSHAGFIPAHPSDPTFEKLLARVQAVADLFAERGVTFLLETGQETAAALNAFLDAVDRPNVGINFDPANMVLYDKGDPIDSLRTLLPRVRQVHLKDARRTATPGTWGAEARLGEGDVDWPALFAVLHDGDWLGPLVVEREAGATRIEDVRHAVALAARAMGAAKSR